MLVFLSLPLSPPPSLYLALSHSSRSLSLSLLGVTSGCGSGYRRREEVRPIARACSCVCVCVFVREKERESERERREGGACLPGCRVDRSCCCLFRSLSSEYGTYKTVKARYWPWLADESSSNVVDFFPLRSKAALRARSRKILDFKI